LAPELPAAAADAPDALEGDAVAGISTSSHPASTKTDSPRAARANRLFTGAMLAGRPALLGGGAAGLALYGLALQ
jgi:hypothetical protein